MSNRRTVECSLRQTSPSRRSKLKPQSHLRSMARSAGRSVRPSFSRFGPARDRWSGGGSPRKEPDVEFGPWICAAAAKSRSNHTQFPSSAEELSIVAPKIGSLYSIRLAERRSPYSLSSALDSTWVRTMTGFTENEISRFC